MVPAGGVGIDYPRAALALTDLAHYGTIGDAIAEFCRQRRGQTIHAASHLHHRRLRRPVGLHIERRNATEEVT
jgi:hypothetical protein